MGIVQQKNFSGSERDKNTIILSFLTAEFHKTQAGQDIVLPFSLAVSPSTQCGSSNTENSHILLSKAAKIQVNTIIFKN